MRTTSALAAIAAAAALTLAACGDDGGGAAGPYVDALVADFEDDGEFPYGESAGRCLVEGYIDAIGVDELEAAGITPEELAAAESRRELGLELGEADVEGLADAIAGCDLSFGEGLLAGGRATGTEVSEDLAACVDDTIDEDAFARFTAQLLVDPATVDQAAAAALFDEVGTACPGFNELRGA